MKSKKQNKNGFTLLELLVAVLVIGVIAAIALPHYRLITLKAEYSQMVNMVRAIGNAQEDFYLTHDRYTSDLNELTVTLPEGLEVGAEGRYYIGKCGLRLNSTYMSGILFKGDKRVASYSFYYRASSLSAYRGTTRCITYASYKDLGDKLCKSLGGEIISNNYSSCGTTGNTICNQYILYYN